MMTYNYYKHNEYLDGELINGYYELNQELHCTRAVYLSKSEYTSTNFIHEDYRYQLPDQSFEEGVDLLDSLSGAEFEELWGKAMKEYEQQWKELKEKFEKDKLIKGSIICLYPQGVIIDLGLKFHGLANYEECQKVLGMERMYPKQQLVFKCTKFDNLNMWIQLNPIKL